MSKTSIEKGWQRLEDLPDGAAVGTSSVRRIAQLKRSYPQLKFKDIRGNLNTRLKKLDEDGVYDAIILAYAGVHRLGLDERLSQLMSLGNEADVDSDFKLPLTTKPMFHAVGQGTLAVECRDGDDRIQSILSTLNDSEAELIISAERSLMKKLEGGCSVPLGVVSHYTRESEELKLSALVCSPDGRDIVQSTHVEKVKQVDEAILVGALLAEDMLDKGAGKILAAIRRPFD